MIFRVELRTQGGEHFTFNNVQVVDTDTRSVYIYEHDSITPMFFRWGKGKDDVKLMRQEIDYADHSRND